MAEPTKYSAEKLLERYEQICSRVSAAVTERPGDEDVQLVAVSKTHPVQAIQTLYDAGHRHFGESYVQEWSDKAESLPDDIKWHFVGNLQSNKARYIAGVVSLVHSADRKSVMKALNRRSEVPVDVLLQVNLGLQGSKGGVAATEVNDLMEVATRYEKIRVRGLMGIPPYSDDAEKTRPYFRRLRQTLEQLQDFVEEHYPARRPGLVELSMGMTHDFGVAIEEGATIVRLGTALFGKRDYDE